MENAKRDYKPGELPPAPFEPTIKAGETPPLSGPYVQEVPGFGFISMGFRCAKCMRLFGPSEKHHVDSCTERWDSGVRMVDTETGEEIDPDHFQAYVARKLAQRPWWWPF